MRREPFGLLGKNLERLLTRRNLANPLVIFQQDEMDGLLFRGRCDILQSASLLFDRCNASCAHGVGAIRHRRNPCCRPLFGRGLFLCDHSDEIT